MLLHPMPALVCGSHWPQAMQTQAMQAMQTQRPWDTVAIKNGIVLSSAVPCCCVFPSQGQKFPMVSETIP
ncbi:hypothetical protein ABBQ38_15546 [Trebouxia sp. C0009 RCD-2024]